MKILFLDISLMSNFNFNNWKLSKFVQEGPKFNSSS